MSGYVQVVGSATASNGRDRKTATATCPSDKKVFGGGYPINPKSPKDWSVTAAEIDQVSPRWSLRPFAICASAPESRPQWFWKAGNRY